MRWAFGLTDFSFPLTPALSLQGEGATLTALGHVQAASVMRQADDDSPSPWREGRGEGKGDVQMFAIYPLATSRRHRTPSLNAVNVSRLNSWLWEWVFFARNFLRQRFSREASDVNRHEHGEDADDPFQHGRRLDAFV